MADGFCSFFFVSQLFLFFLRIFCEMASKKFPSSAVWSCFFVPKHSTKLRLHRSKFPWPRFHWWKYHRCGDRKNSQDVWSETWWLVWAVLVAALPLVNLPPLTYPLQKQGFHKALLRDTSGFIAFSRRSGLDDLPMKNSLPPVGNSKVLDVRHLSSVVWQVAMCWEVKNGWEFEKKNLHQLRALVKLPVSCYIYIYIVCVFFCFLFMVKHPYFQEKGRDLYTDFDPHFRKYLKNNNPTNGSGEFFRGPLRCGATWPPGEAFISGLSDMRRGLAMCSASPPMKVPAVRNVERQGKGMEGQVLDPWMEGVLYHQNP